MAPVLDCSDSYAETSFHPRANRSPRVCSHEPALSRQRKAGCAIAVELLEGAVPPPFQPGVSLGAPLCPDCAFQRMTQPFVYGFCAPQSVRICQVVLGPPGSGFIPLADSRVPLRTGARGGRGGEARGGAHQCRGPGEPIRGGAAPENARKALQYVDANLKQSKPFRRVHFGMCLVPRVVTLCSTWNAP